MLLASDSDVGGTLAKIHKHCPFVKWPTKPSFGGSRVILGGATPPHSCVSATLALFWGSQGAWEGKENFHNLSLLFPQEIITLSNPEGKVSLEAQSGDQEYLFELSCSQDQMCFLVMGWWYWSILVYHKHSLSRKSPQTPAASLTPSALIPSSRDLNEANYLSISISRAFHNPDSNEQLRNMHIHLGQSVRVSETPFGDSSRESTLLFSAGHKPKGCKGWSHSSHFAAKKLELT